MNVYKKSTDFSSRKLESSTISKYWPDKLPIILLKEPTSSFPDLEKPKFLCPKDSSVLQFLIYMRRKVNLPKKSGLFIHTEDGEVLSGDKMMVDIYERHHDPDGFLYLKYGEHYVYG